MKTPKDIQDLNKRINRFKAEEKKAEREVAADQNAYTRPAAAFQISTELLAGVLIGAGIGYLLDIFFSTKPWFLAVFTILGGAGGILSIYRTFKAESKTKE